VSNIDDEEIENSDLKLHFLLQENIVIAMNHCSDKTWFTNYDEIRQGKIRPVKEKGLKSIDFILKCQNANRFEECHNGCCQ
jgi:predicted transcriptional regulator